MKTQIAFEQYDYLRERIVAVGDAVSELDLTATTTNYISSGACDPIEAYGTRPLYRIWDIDIPDWLLAGLERGKQDGRWPHESALEAAARIISGRYEWRSATERALWSMTLRTRPSKRERLLHVSFVACGTLTAEQAASIR